MQHINRREAINDAYYQCITMHLILLERCFKLMLNVMYTVFAFAMIILITSFSFLLKKFQNGEITKTPRVQSIGTG